MILHVQKCALMKEEWRSWFSLDSSNTAQYDRYVHKCKPGILWALINTNTFWGISNELISFQVHYTLRLLELLYYFIFLNDESVYQWGLKELYHRKQNKDGTSALISLDSNMRKAGGLKILVELPDFYIAFYIKHLPNKASTIFSFFLR